MEFDQLRTLLAVVEHRSFSRAAEALRLTQPTVSLQIRALEHGVGARLLERQPRRVRPTAAGRELVAYALRLLSLRREAAERIRATEGLLAGDLRLAASNIPGEYVLPVLLAEFHRRHPGVRVAMRVVDSEEATDALLAGTVELAAVGSRRRDRRLVYQALGEDEIVLVGPRGTARTLDPEALPSVPLIMRERGSGTRDALAGLLARWRIDLGDLRIALELGSTEAVKSAVRAGAGLAFLSRLAVREDLAAHRLVEVPFADLPHRRRFWLVRLRGDTPSPASRALLELVRSRGDLPVPPSARHRRERR